MISIIFAALAGGQLAVENMGWFIFWFIAAVIFK